jgi:hypothetical protein
MIFMNHKVYSDTNKFLVRFCMFLMKWFMRMYSVQNILDEILYVPESVIYCQFFGIY